MFEGAFPRREFPWRSNACAPLRHHLAPFNNSSGSNSRVLLADNSCNQTDVNMSATFLPVALTGLALSALSTRLFLRQRQRTAFRASQLSLTLAMSLYLFFSAVDFANVLAGACQYWNEPGRQPQVVLGSLACLMVDATLCLRNWCAALIAAQRAEVVVFPLRPRKLLSPANFRALLLTLAAGLCLPLAVVRSLSEALVVCGNFASVGFPLSERDVAAAAAADAPALEAARPHYSYLLATAWYDNFEVYVFFTVQTVFPVSLVILLSLVMSGVMLRCRLRQGGHNETEPDNQPALASGPARAKRNRVRASRTVLCLAAIFTALQTPVFVGTLLKHAGAIDVESAAGKSFQFFAELCLLLDSIFNTIVYAYYVPEFRRFFRRLFCLLFRRRLHQPQSLPPPPLQPELAASELRVVRRQQFVASTAVCGCDDDRNTSSPFFRMQ